ncbi:FAD-dependent monooxygenase [Pseudomonas sp. B21-056]|jgi:2-polyprenyl-6-methoxyphenol hydroxylase-like FAD-dependent oxidoreductase|uniref:FAD-dependent oxidoreductase n=1 Tax=Pseudomonas sp. B21-056 TaxID=2895495 RepID=UPI00222EE94F|nr:FAD-dependent monooxygenase [Pseudomonas sp. B21-056]UZE25899.1 FAD-dependent monooxygenase [Pseudomonas sp. B21-056]
MKHSAQVIIVGAGPVGLLTALALAQENVSVIVLEADAKVSDAPRASVYFPSTITALDKLGMLQDVTAASERGISFATRIPEFGFISEIQHSVMKGITYEYQLHCGQDELALIAIRHAEKVGVDIRFNHRVLALSQDSHGVALTVMTPEGEQVLKADYVIGCDGARSTIRKLLDLSFDGHTWPTRFVATNVYCNFTKHGYCPANIMLDPIDGGVVMSLGKPDFWRVTYAEDGTLAPETHRERIMQRYARIMPKDEPFELVASNPYTIHQRAASSFRVGRTLLAGDAAHATNPLGGLGLTGGLWDGMILADLLAAVLRNESKDDVLDQWAIERKRVFWEVASAGASENKRMVEEKDPIQRRLDMERLQATADNPEAGRQMMLYPFKLIGDVIRPGSRWEGTDPTPNAGIDLSQRQSQFR